MSDDELEARLRSALDELTRSAPLANPEHPRSGDPVDGPVVLAGVDGIAGGPGGDGASSSRRPPTKVDPKLFVAAACALVLVGGLTWFGLSRASKDHHPNVVSTSTTTPVSSTTVPTTSTITAPTTSSTTTEPLPTAANDLAPGPTQYQVDPSLLSLSGDASDIVQNIRWAAWEQSGATGYGTVDIEGCVPSCAQGTQTPTPVTIYLNDAVNGKFTLLTEDVSGGQPQNFSLVVGGWQRTNQ